MIRRAPDRALVSSLALSRGTIFHSFQSGNDLSRTFGWGPGFTRSMLKPKFLERVKEAPPAKLDRCCLPVVVRRGANECLAVELLFAFAETASLASYSFQAHLAAGGGSRIVGVVYVGTS